MDNNTVSYDELPMVLSVGQLKSILCIGKNLAYDLVKSGKIRSIHIGKNIRIPRSALLAYLDQNDSCDGMNS